VSPAVTSLAARRAIHPHRGQVYWLDIPGIGRKPWLIVSNDAVNRNQALEHLIAVRISTTVRDRHVPTVVPLGASDPLTGCVLAATVMQLRRRWFVAPAGAVSPDTMRAVDEALAEVLALPRG
jgi:mRNA interferase MazF